MLYLGTVRRDLDADHKALVGAYGVRRADMYGGGLSLQSLICENKNLKQNALPGGKPK